MSLASRVRVAVSFCLMCIAAVAMLLAAIPTLFLARRFYAEVMARWTGAALLRLWGIRFTVHELAPVPQRQVVYVSNHPSTLDVFLLIALGLPRTRFFMHRIVGKIIPIGIIGTIIRIFWTVPQEHTEERRRIFARAARVLKRTGDSVYLSPEGMRVATGEIGHFNKGAFHMATDLRAPIVPIYLHVPPETSPGMGLDARPGMVDVYFLPAIETSRWTVADVERNRDRVRDLFVRVHESVKDAGRLPDDLAPPPETADSAMEAVA